MTKVMEIAIRRTFSPHQRNEFKAPRVNERDEQLIRINELVIRTER